MNKRFVVFAVGIVLSLIGIIGLSRATASADGYTANCGTTAVVKCGVYEQKEIDAATPEAKALYSKLGISTNLSAAKQGVVYPDGTVKVNNETVATGAMTFGRAKRQVSDTAESAGGYTFWKHSITGAAIYRAVNAHVFFDANGNFVGAIIHMCGNPVVATPVPKPEPPKPQPKPQSIKCTNLEVKIVDESKLKVEAKVTGTPENTTISGYKIDFGDGTSATTQTATHTYKDYGTYTITGYVSGQVDGATQTVSDPVKCVDEIEFIAPPQSIRCKVLTMITNDTSKRYVKVTVEGVAENTTIDGYKINFGDNTAPVEQQTAEHTYAADGTFRIVGSVSGMVDGKATGWVSSENCEQKVTYSPTPVPPTMIEVCELSTKNIITIDEKTFDASKHSKDLADCEEPEVMPNTGPAAAFGVFTGVSALGAFGHRIWMSRRNRF